VEIKYAKNKVEIYCTDLKAAIKLFGGNKQLAISLQSKINSIKAAVVLKDIIVIKNNNFHKLEGNLNGYFAIDVKTRKDPWRIIFRPLDEEYSIFVPCHIDEISSIVKCVEIKEVSKHYE